MRIRRTECLRYRAAGSELPAAIGHGLPDKSLTHPTRHGRVVGCAKLAGDMYTSPTGPTASAGTTMRRNTQSATSIATLAVGCWQSTAQPPIAKDPAGGRTYRGPLTPVMATLSEDEQQLYLIMANGSWETAVPTRISLRSRLPRQVTGIVLSHGDADGDPFLENREELVQDLAIEAEGQELTALLPPHAVAFVTIRLD